MPRIPSVTRLLACALLFAWPAASMTGEAAASGAGMLATRFVEAWNAHDAAAFGALMAKDADWVTAAGDRLLGRDAIQAYLAEEHAAWAKATTMRATNVHVRSLSGVTAVVNFQWEIATPAKDGGAPAVARGNNLFVATNDEGWIIVSGQVARTRAR